MTINGKKYNFILELRIRANKDANAYIQPTSQNPVYMEVYNETMKLNGSQAAYHNQAPQTENPVFMEAYNATMTDIRNGDDCFSEYARKDWASF